MGYKRILVPVDGSATSKAGLREAITLAKGQGAQLQLVHVADQHYIALMGIESSGAIGEMMESTKRVGRGILRNAEAAAQKAGVKASSVLLETVTGPAADPIVRQAKKWGADLIVLGTHGRRGVRRLLMGSDAEQIVRYAPVPVMLVRSGG
ncbi:MAG TPA: universal stress protein [Burkholderiales bacterium]|nr:universal stress protein [Burkholderiales bacterium]